MKKREKIKMFLSSKVSLLKRLLDSGNPNVFIYHFSELDYSSEMTISKLESLQTCQVKECVYGEETKGNSFGNKPNV